MGGDSMMKISELQTKDVVNLIDGRNLGQVSDLEVAITGGNIDAIIVPGPKKFFGLMSDGKDYIIPWKNIVKIGKDVVLVRLDPPKYLDSGENSDGIYWKDKKEQN
jgi:YlmC/YmxH family sporulation protein